MVFENCWPAIRKAVPGIRFSLIGKDTDGPLKPLDRDVDVLGWVEDPAGEIATWSATVIPIRFGGGTRIKIADAFSRKCPVVSTRFGAFGYDVHHGNELLLADDNDPKAFASSCISLIQNPSDGGRDGRTGLPGLPGKVDVGSYCPTRLGRRRGLS